MANRAAVSRQTVPEALTDWCVSAAADGAGMVLVGLGVPRFLNETATANGVDGGARARRLRASGDAGNAAHFGGGGAFRQNRGQTHPRCGLGWCSGARQP